MEHLSKILTMLYNELIGFLGIGPLLDMYHKGDYSSLHSLQGIENAIGPVIPFLLILEILRAAFFRRFKVIDYKVQFFTYVFNQFAGRFIAIAATAYCIALFQKHGLLRTTFTWYWLIYGYLAWELSHFVYHYLAHKVRLLWCLHSTHHAPQTMNLSVTYAHFILEAPYADVIRTSICILLGVNPPLLFFIMFIDGTWGAFIHAGENVLGDGKLGFLNKIILTPSRHRVHHARNPAYMDTNFCNLLNIWDRVFGTLADERKDIPIEYGITRKMNPNSFWDVYFGEIVALAKDVYHAPGLPNKILYIVMPPGWSHTGDHKTAKVVRREFLSRAHQKAGEETQKETEENHSYSL